MSPYDAVLSGARARNIVHGYLTSPLSVLAMWQPWAMLFCAPDPLNNDDPAKTHETRHWYPSAGQKVPFAVAVHATKKFDGTTKAALENARFRDALKRCGFYPGDARPLTQRNMQIPGGLRALPFGEIIGLAIIDLIVSAQPLSMRAELDGVQALDLSTLSPDDRAFGYFEPHELETEGSKVRYGWRARDTILLPQSIPHHGRQDALYPVDREIREAIDDQLRTLEAQL